MPELPDVTIYVERLRAMVGGHRLEGIDIKSPFLLRSVDPRPDLRTLDPGGLEVMDCSAAAFRDRLFSERHTLKRALTDPRLFSGIGNAFSDEILHRARLSPLQVTTNLAHEEARRLHRATMDTLTDWTARIRHEVGEGFPDRVTAFRNGMAVHGRYGQPCPVCGTAVQRIVYLRTEVNYCPRCQTGGRILADRAFSRILRDDWPKTIEEWEGLGSSKV